MTTQPETKRMKLKITGQEPVQEKPRQDGQGNYKILTVSATDGEGKEYSYGCFNAKLFEALKVGAEVEADIETRQNQDKNGNIYINRSIKQIYQGGEAIAAKRQFGGNYKSPEERASIEWQVCMKEVGEWMRVLITAPQVPEAFVIPTPLVKLYTNALLAKLGAPVAPPQPHGAAPSSQPSVSSDKPANDQNLPPEGQEVTWEGLSKEAPANSLYNLQLSNQGKLSKLGKKTPEQITDYLGTLNIRRVPFAQLTLTEQQKLAGILNPKKEG